MTRTVTVGKMRGFFLMRISNEEKEKMKKQRT